MKNTILVIGATGNQGEAVLQALLKTDFALRAFVRKHNPKQSQNPKIQKLKEQGIEVMEGDLDDVDSLTHAMNGCYGVFSVINFQDGGVAKEEERGKRVAEKPLQMIAVQDIGKWAAHMFLHRERYLSMAVEIAGDEVTFSQMVSAYKKVYNKTPGSMWFPPSLFSMGDIGKMFTWITTYGYKADLKMNRTEIPDLLSFEQFLVLKKPL